MGMSPGTTASSFGNKEHYIPLQPREMVPQGRMTFTSNIITLTMYKQFLTNQINTFDGVN